jgi:dUTP pyrophosphatase
MPLYVKLLTPTSKSPERATPGAAGYDLFSHSVVTTKYYVEFGTGVAVAIPEGHVGLLAARSSITDSGWCLATGVGVIDPDYRGELCVRFTPTARAVREWSESPLRPPYELGERIAQLIIAPIANALQIVDELDYTVRGVGGFGSTGLK